MLSLKQAYFTSLFVLFTATYSIAQTTTQTLRGTIIDQVTHQPMAFANVIIHDTIATNTDLQGEFRFDNLPLGRYNILVTYLGYEDLILNNVQLNAGKETIIQATMSESATYMDEVIVSASKEKTKPLNEMALISTRMVSVDESQRYAASFNDPARMANSFAGVIQTDAGNNHIAIRGNAPNGLLWRMEGIDIPNPNHFSYVGTAGGGVSILSGQLLANSDFSTSAFTAEYGNALSGVFDIKLRKGNNETREYTFQLGALGIDVAAEGPFKKGKNSSYLVNYRYSTLGILSNIIDLGGQVTNFQDLSYNLSFKNNKWGDVTFFGVNGLSDQRGKDTLFDQKIDFVANTLVNGLTHSKTIGNNTFWKSALVYSSTENKILAQENDVSSPYTEYTSYDEKHQNQKLTLSSKIQHKISSRTFIKGGIIQSHIGYRLHKITKDSSMANEQTLFFQNGNTSISQAYVQLQHKYSNTFTSNLGIHLIYNWLNNSKSIEPRAALQYTPKTGHQVTLGYGLHSQILPQSVYFLEVEKEEKLQLANKNLGLSKAHHLVLGYNMQPTSLLNIKAETYLQALFNIPQGLVKEDNISLLNMEFGTPELALENKGVGRNYGIEMTVDKYLHHGFYITMTGSLYDSKYKGTDGQWYNTRFNGNFAATSTAGKEFSISSKKNRTMGIHAKITYTGGLRDHTIDLEESIRANKTIFDTSTPYNIQYKNFLRIDLKLIFKRNYRRVTSSLIFDMQNIANKENFNSQFYNPKSKMVDYYRQVGLLPVISYKLEF